MEVKVLWESSENETTRKETKLKEFLADYSPSLQDQLVDKDYQLKFNNNSLNRVLMNNQIGDLIEKFQGSKILITPSEESLKEIENLKNQIEQKFQNWQKLKNTMKLNLSNLSVNKESLLNKLTTLTVPLNETNTYFCKMIEKIVDTLTPYEFFLKDNKTKEMMDNFKKLRVEEIVPLFSKILTYYLEKVHEFIYKYGLIFLENQQLFNILIDTYMVLVLNFYAPIFIKIKNHTKMKNLVENHSGCIKEILDESIPDSVFEHCYLKPIESKTSNLKFFSFEEPVKINISENEYLELKNILSQFPSVYDQLNTNKSSADKIRDVLQLTLQRNIQIYISYGIKMEDFGLASLIYETKVC